MASERDAAKRSITDQEAKDPDLGVALKDANEFRLKLATEDHRHAETMAGKELGWFGTVFGGTANAPTMVAFLALVLFAVIGCGCLLAAAYFGNPARASDGTLLVEQLAAAKELAGFWGDHARNAFAVSLSALGFIFGRSTAKKKPSNSSGSPAKNG